MRIIITLGRAKPAFSTSLHFPSTLQFIIIPQRVAIEEDRGGLLFRRALSALGKKGSDGFFFFLFGKGGEVVHAAVECAPPSAPNAGAPSSSFLGGQSLPEDSKERRRRRGAHCYIVMGTWAYTLKIQAKKLEFPTILLLLVVQKKTRKRNQCIPFAPDLEECKTPGAKIKSFKTL